jgi:hypothetical protein
MASGFYSRCALNASGTLALQSRSRQRLKELLACNLFRNVLKKDYKKISPQDFEILCPFPGSKVI